jgi:thioredoxin-like negative regulator of GroEL
MKHHITSLAIISLAVLSLLTASVPCTWADGGLQSTTQQQPLFTHHTLDHAWQTAVVRKRPMLVMFSTEGCHFCTKMLAETYSQPEVRRMLREHVEAVKVDAREYPAIVERLGIRGYPTTLLVSPDGSVLDAIEGFATAKAFTGRIAPLLKSSGYPAGARAVSTRTGRTGRVGS